MNFTAIGELIRKKRERRKMSFEDVAAASGLHRNTVRGIEAGVSDHGLGTFEAVGAAVGVSLLSIVRAAKAKR